MYLMGFALGETALFGWWARNQDRGNGVRAYWLKQKGQVILSGSVALVACVAWAEGSLASYLPDGLEFRLGVSAIAGFTLTFFAHGAIAWIAKRYGVDAP
jgi:hypothetical protein